MASAHSDGPRLPDSMAAGFLAGALGGLIFLVTALFRDGQDIADYWPDTAFTLWLGMRSKAAYALLFGAGGVVLGLLLHLLLPRRRAAIFGLVLGAAGALTLFASLTAWWQIEVIAGLPMDDPERLRRAVQHALAALAVGGLVGIPWLIIARNRRIGPALVQWTLVTFGGLILLLILADSMLDGSGPATAAPKPGRPSQVVVVGLDGMTLRVLSPLLRAGEMSTFRRLMAEGAWGTFMTYGTASSPQVWTSMATGKRVRDHGIDDFVKGHDGQAGNYRAALMRSSDRTARAIWNILSDAGRRVAIIDWLVTYPPEEVNGYLVSRLKLEATGRTYPPGLDVELDGLWSERPTDDHEQLMWNIDRVFGAAHHLLDKERLDFLAVFDATIDRVEHQTWKYYQPEAFDAELWQIDPAEAAKNASLIPDVYRHLDRRLGELLERVSDNALVLVVSDHGQRAARAPRVRLRLDRVLAALGYSRLLPGSGPRDGVDYAASRAYALVETPWKPVLRVNLNLKGREAHGVVEPKDAEALTERLVADLRDVRFSDGTPLFTAVTRRRAGSSRGADIRVALSRHARSVGRSADLLAIGEEPLPLSHYQRINPSISGAHDHQGVIFAHGPGVEPGFIGQRVIPTAAHDLLWHLTDKVDAVDRLLPGLRWLGLIDRASTLDLTPTVLYALGLPVGRDMFGRPLRSLFSDLPDVEWIASYESADEPRDPDEGVAEEPSDEEVMKRLRALGYVE